MSTTTTTVSRTQQFKDNTCAKVTTIVFVIVTVIGIIMMIAAEVKHEGCKDDLAKKQGYFYSHYKACYDESVTISSIGIVLLVIGFIGALVGCCVGCGCCCAKTETATTVTTNAEATPMVQQAVPAAKV